LQKDDVLRRNLPAQRDTKSHMTDFRSFLQLGDEEVDELDPNQNKKPGLDEDGNPIDDGEEVGDEDDDDDEDEDGDEDGN
jgi:hypothetical protein